jgi:hypothetical protein
LPRSCDLEYVRKRPLETVLKELHEYRRLHAPLIRAFSFTDDQFLTGREWLELFFEAYAELDTPLVFLATAGAVNEKVASQAARARTYMVRMGVESGNETLRKRVLNRRTSNLAIGNAVRTLQRAGINAFSFNMLGIPGESMSDALGTFRFAAELGWDAVKFSMFWPYPGTALFESCVRHDLVRGDIGFVGNNIDDTPLRWPPRQQRFYRRIARFYDVAMNAHLPEPEAVHFARLLTKVERLDEPAWTDGARSLRRRANELIADALERGGFAYTSPFRDRYDIVLLQGRRRSRPLLT